MPDGVQSLSIVLNQSPAVEKVQDFDLRAAQYLQQAATEADQARVARSLSQVQPSDRSRSGARVSAEGEPGPGGQPAEQDRPERPPRATRLEAAAGQPPRPGSIVDVVV